MLDSATEKTTFPRRDALFLFIIVLFGAFLRIYHLGTKGLWGDEIWTATWSQVGLTQIIVQLTRPPDMPFLYVLAHIFTKIGNNEFWLRLPSALFGIGSILGIYMLANAIARQKVALISATIMGISPIFIWYSQDARYYTIICTLGILSIFFFYKGIETLSFIHWVLFVLVTSIAVYSHIFLFWIIIAELIFVSYIMINRFRNRFMMRERNMSFERLTVFVVCSFACLMLVSLPVIIAVLRVLQNGVGPTGEGLASLTLLPRVPRFFTYDFVIYSLVQFSGGHTLIYLFVPLFVIGLVNIWKNAREGAILIGIVMITPYISVLFLDFNHDVTVRYFIFLVPFYILAVSAGILIMANSLARGIVFVYKGRGKKRTHVLKNIRTLCLGVIMAAVVLLLIKPITLVYRQAKINDWRAVASYLDKQVKPGDVILGEYWFREALLYYFEKQDSIMFLRGETDKLQHLDQFGGRVWFVGLGGSVEEEVKKLFSSIPKSQWQDPRFHYPSQEESGFSFSVTEPSANLYLLADNPISSSIDFADIEGADWTPVTYRAISPGQESRFYLSTEGINPRVLQLAYLDYEGGDFDVLIDDKLIDSLLTGQMGGGWRTWQIPVPDDAAATFQVTLQAKGDKDAAFDRIELVSLPRIDASSPETSYLDLDEVQNVEWTNETYEHIEPGETYLLTVLGVDGNDWALRVRYLDHPSKMVEVLVNGEPLGRLGGNAKGGGWVEETLPLTPDMGKPLLVAITSVGAEASGISELSVQALSQAAAVDQSATNGNGLRLLVLGNSITVHSPAPELGWMGDWGMAASARENDFVHVLQDELASSSQNIVELRYHNISDFERDYSNYVFDDLVTYRDYQPDIFVVRIGDNVTDTISIDQDFVNKYRELILYIANNKNPATICSSSWYSKQIVDQSMQEACLSLGGTYVDISDLFADPSNRASSERPIENEGVGSHPGDKGMREIAGRLFAAIDPEIYCGNCRQQYLPLILVPFN